MNILGFRSIPLLREIGSAWQGWMLYVGDGVPMNTQEKPRRVQGFGSRIFHRVQQVLRLRVQGLGLGFRVWV